MFDEETIFYVGVNQLIPGFSNCGYLAEQHSEFMDLQIKTEQFEFFEDDE